MPNIIDGMAVELMNHSAQKAGKMQDSVGLAKLMTAMRLVQGIPKGM